MCPLDTVVSALLLHTIYRTIKRRIGDHRLPELDLASLVALKENRTRGAGRKPGNFVRFGIYLGFLPPRPCAGYRTTTVAIRESIFERPRYIRMGQRSRTSRR